MTAKSVRLSFVSSDEKALRVMVREARRDAAIQERKERERSAALDAKWQRLLAKVLRS